MEASCWERLTVGKLGLVLKSEVKLSKSLIQFSVDGLGCVPFLLFEGGNGTPLQYSCLENPWTEETGGLQSMGSLRVWHD